MLRLGFAGCRGGDTDDLLRGIENGRWVAAGPTVGSEGAASAVGLVGQRGDGANDPSHGTRQGGGRRREEGSRNPLTWVFHLQKEDEMNICFEFVWSGRSSRWMKSEGSLERDRSCVSRSA
jgi:hypothetical protein